MGTPDKYVGISSSSIQDIIEAINSGALINLRVTGNSMYPFLISGRDTVVLSKPKRNLKKYDIVLYKGENGKYMLHRIIKTFSDKTYELCGDGQLVSDYPVQRSQIAASVTSVLRKGLIIRKDSFKWKLYSRLCTNGIIKRFLIKKALKKRGKSD